MAEKSLADLIRERVMAQLREKFGGLLPGETVPPLPGVAYRPVPVGVVLLSSCVECPECFSMVLQTSTASHTAAHVAEAAERARRDMGDPDYVSMPMPGAFQPDE